MEVFINLDSACHDLKIEQYRSYIRRWAAHCGSRKPSMRRTSQQTTRPLPRTMCRIDPSDGRSAPINNEKLPGHKDTSSSQFESPELARPPQRTISPSGITPNETHGNACDTSDSCLLTLTSPGAIREQLVQQFLVHHLQHGLRNRHFILQHYREWLEPKSTTQAIAIDSSLLLLCGSVNNDPAVTRHGEQLHYGAISKLHAEIQKPLKAFDDGSILGTILLLGIGGQYRELAVSDPLDHIKGLLAMIDTRGPTLLRSTFAKNTILEILPVVQLLAATQRRASFFAKAEWIDALRPHCKSITSQALLQGIQLPTLLEQIDKARPKQGQTREELYRILQGLIKLDCHLKYLHASWYVHSSRDELCWATEPEQRFARALSTLSMMGLSSFPFKTAYDFEDLEIALSHFWYWYYLFTDRLAIHGLSSWPVIRYLSPVTEPDKAQNLAREIQEIADSICRSVPFLLSQPVNVALGVSCGLSCVRPWYEANDNMIMAQWCQGLFENLQDRNINPQFYDGATCADRTFCGWLMLNKGGKTNSPIRVELSPADSAEQVT